MIVSVSRRTDIPAFYGRWFMNRIRAGFCLVRNPFNPNQVQEISLRPEDVTSFVFWTRNAIPFLRYMDELEESGYRYYFLYTLTGYDRELETHLPGTNTRISQFRRLVERVGIEKVIWRYDPIIISKNYSFDWHRKTFETISRELSGLSPRVIVSFVDYYRKTRNNLSQKRDKFVSQPEELPGFLEFVSDLAALAHHHNFRVTSCSEELDFSTLGVPPGKCIDDEWLHSLYGLKVSNKKDPNQRKYCRCVESKDIGAYHTCPSGCVYCYATAARKRALEYLKSHNSDSEWLG